jgi:short-subunit dehydrogenase
MRISRHRVQDSRVQDSRWLTGVLSVPLKNAAAARNFFCKLFGELNMSGHKKTALVTGASSGMGAEFCRQLADSCDVVIAIARRGERLAALAESLEDKAEIHIIEADLCSVEGLTRAVEALRQKGPVDYLVNNAGFSTFGMFEDKIVDSQQDMVSLHINATMVLSRAAIPFMRELGGGHIINVSSMSTFMPGRGLAVYGATKAFVTYFSQALAQELVGSGIKMQALCPGYTRTEMHSTGDFADFDQSRIPEHLWMDASEVVATSLAALAGDAVVVVPGEGNQALSRAAMEQQLEIFA